jgi:hypothetical protein
VTGVPSVHATRTAPLVAEARGLAVLAWVQYHPKRVMPVPPGKRTILCMCPAIGGDEYSVSAYGTLGRVESEGGEFKASILPTTDGS